MEPLFFMLGGVALSAVLFAVFVSWHDRRAKREDLRRKLLP